MTDRDALYRAILDSPDDDTLRLVYADALEESGDATRAAFVRARVELALVPKYDPLAVRARYHSQAREEAARWLAELPPLPDGLSWPRDPFRRGLPGAVRSRDGAAFVTRAEYLFANYPIEALELTVVRLAEAADLAACPYLGRLTSLSFTQGVSRQGIAPLLESEHTGRLTALHLGPQFTTAEAIGTIARNRLFDRLTGLSVRAERAGGAVTAALARQHPPRLKQLDISGNRLGPAALDQLLASTVLDSLEELDLGDNNLGPDGVALLARAALPNLRALHLARTRPGIEGVAALCAAGFYRELRVLSLGGNNLGPEAALDLAGAPGKLLALDLADNRPGDTGALALAQSAPLAGLQHLNLTGCAIGAPVAARLRKRFGDRVSL